MAAPLLERGAELDALDSALAAARAGEGSVVLLSGEAGIGKTSLVRAFGRRVGTRARLLTGACDDLLSPRTLGPLRDAARAVPDGPLAAALARGDRDAVLTALDDELADARRPTVLVVEDVHWADDATLDALRFVGRRIADRPAVVLISYRDDEVGPALARLLGGLTGDAVRRLPLRRLSRTAVAQWAGGTSATSAALYRVTGGNPFYVSEMLATGGAAESVPVTVVDAVLARVRRLDPATQRALEQLAVVPSRVELPLARALLGDLAVVAEAERSGVVEVRADALAFRHELARRAVEGATATTDRMAAHERVVRALTARPESDPARIVHHAVRAGDDATVLARAPEAARRAAAAGAQGQAATLYEEALRRASLLPPEQRAALREAHAWTLFHCNRRRDAVRAADEAVALREGLGDPAALGRALATASLQQWTDLRIPAASTSAERAVRLLEPAGDSAALVAALHFLGVLLINIDREAEGRERVEAALAMGERVGSAAWRASGLVYRGRARMQCGDDGGRDDVAAGIALARTDGDHEAVMIGYINLVGVLWRRGHHVEMERRIAESEAYGRERDFPTHDRARDAYRYRLLALRGDWDAAERGLRELVEDPDGAGVVTRHALPGLARLVVRRGRPDAEQVVAAARENGDLADSLQAVVPAVVAAMELAWLSDRAEPARSAGRALL
ncbi:MAG: hypothetical protein QOK35_2385, partial [Pseudonocardiales bacterium]|nr:hypothetical protein [Pseudonocardiales bacterium]